MYRGIWVLCGLLFLGGCASIERLAIPKPELVETQLSQTGTSASPDHAVWDGFLSRYVSVGDDGVARVDYGGVTPEDGAALDDYIARLSDLDATRWTRNAQLAYWSNLYNAKTVSVILQHYPVESIRHITDGLLDLGPWEDKRLVVNDKPLSLHDIEHGVVRPLWADTPEIHYLLNCAAVGCPNLVTFAYDEDNVTQALSDNARSFINDPRGVRLDSHGRLVLSKIYAWYLPDFGGSEDSIVEHLLEYADEDTRELLNRDTRSVRYVYDWTLNDAR